ncbi:cupin [Idiomarina sp. MD25a]|uniref:cupin domain-containing protein n=1 Tax=Idiomarina sp. MD25a TaxID=1889913 RepID=UPI0008F8DD1E|nr:cupin domain-containing protein [Idiomarina sp. MD25a]OIN02133.1 cupin [Idiomarina sp. MD25a]
MHLQNVDKQVFLDSDWQKRPRLFKRGLANVDLIEPEILAGLAMEDGVDARIIEHRDQAWSVAHGPFQEYESLGEANWTLLVQAVNEWMPDVHSLLQAFRFLPEWRIDDVMVSFSVEGGGVGPHVDEYDVFIVQGAGRRHWRVGARQSTTPTYPCEDLKQIKESFDAVIDEVLEPGDVLYIPAGCPHDGIALEPCLNYSVGFRAPNQAEWLAQLADMALQTEQLKQRYTDPNLSCDNPSHIVTEAQLGQVKQLLKSAVESSDFDELILRAQSMSKRPLPEPELPMVAEQVPALLTMDKATVVRAPGSRLLKHFDRPHYFANGELFVVTAEAEALAKQLAELTDETAITELAPLCNDACGQALIAWLVNQGVIELLID